MVRNARWRGEREAPYAEVRVGYVVELFELPRFAALDAAVRQAVVLNAIHHHERHLLEDDGAVTTAPPAYIRRWRQRGAKWGGGAGNAHFGVGEEPVVAAMLST